jgi:hypothetical protein
MADSVEFTSEPAPEVLRYFRAKGMKPAFDWRDVWGNEHATAFTVAKATKLDVLETLRQAVDDAIAKGETFASFRANLEPKLKALGWWGGKDVVDPETGKEVSAQLGSPRRLRTIYSANIRSAFAAGIWERAQRTKSTRGFFAYRLGPSIVHRPHHVAREGMVYPVDHPIWDTWFPPNGWGCKCWVLQITREDAESFGYRDDMPEPLVQTKGYLNKRTGELEQVPVGIDPGWHTNPGKFRAGNWRSFLAGRLEAAPKDLRDAAIQDTRVELVVPADPGGQDHRQECRGAHRSATERAGSPHGVLRRRSRRCAGGEGTDAGRLYGSAAPDRYRRRDRHVRRERSVCRRG